MHLFRIEFQMYAMNRSFDLKSNFLKIFNQSEDRNRNGRKRKDVSEAQNDIENEARSLMEN